MINQTQGDAGPEEVGVAQHPVIGYIVWALLFGALFAWEGLALSHLSGSVPTLSDTFRLIYVDQRGQGRSERVDPATLSLSRFAEDVSKLAATLGLRQYALLGHSYGGVLAQARTRPPHRERVWSHRGDGRVLHL